MKFIALYLHLLLALAGHVPADAQAPDWVLKDWEYLASEGGIWLADNSEYKSADEPFEEYGLQWTLGSDRSCLRGRLFGKAIGNETITFWEFFLFWDRIKEKTRIIQVSSNGTVGEGWLWQSANGSIMSEQRFTRPDGTFFDSGHEERSIGQNERSTLSFDIEAGVWVPRRKYLWRRN